MLKATRPFILEDPAPNSVIQARRGGDWGVRVGDGLRCTDANTNLYIWLNMSFVRQSLL